MCHSVVVYMDDLLCYNPTLEHHIKDVQELLSILRQEKLYVKASKCEFGRSELGSLGHRISVADVSVDPRKVSAIQSRVQRRCALLCLSLELLSPVHRRVRRHRGPADSVVRPSCSIFLGT